MEQQKKSEEFSSHHSIVFRPSGRGKAQNPSNPEYPHGIALNAAPSEPSCLVKLPYPAPECGGWEVLCKFCGISVFVTAAGRPDDPISLKISCDLDESSPQEKNN